MDFQIIDSYLLSGRPSKADVIAALLRRPSDLPEAAPYYRALAAVGARAADEALIALRLVGSGKELEDGTVRRIRALGGLARAIAIARKDLGAATAVLKKDGEAVLDVVSKPPLDPAALQGLREPVERAYAKTVA